MKIWLHVVLQVLGFIAQYANLASGVVPAKYQPFVALAVGLAQAILAWFNHYYTPDGQPIKA
jgi:hypothetical protein